MGETGENIEHEENSKATGQETEFEKLYSQSIKQFKSGTLVRGRVLQIQSGFVMLDLGYKSDGIIPVEQFTEDELKTLKPGDELEVLLEAAEDSNGNIMLSRDKAKKLQVWDDLNRAYQTGTPVMGKVLASIKGGLSVDIGGVEAFLPGSQVDIKPVQNQARMVGQSLEMKIIKMNSGRGNIVLSRRAILEQQQNLKKEATLSSSRRRPDRERRHQEHYRLRRVCGPWRHRRSHAHYRHILEQDQPSFRGCSRSATRVDVVVLKYDREKQKVSLGMKQKTQDPWLSVAEKYPVGSSGARQGDEPDRLRRIRGTGTRR